MKIEECVPSGSLCDEIMLSHAACDETESESELYE